MDLSTAIGDDVAWTVLVPAGFVHLLIISSFTTFVHNNSTQRYDISQFIHSSQLLIDTNWLDNNGQILISHTRHQKSSRTMIIEEPLDTLKLTKVKGACEITKSNKLDY
jgi:hypothetical protein